MMLTKKIISPDKDPLGTMLLDYLNGKKQAAVKVMSPDLDMWKMRGELMFRSFGRMNQIERRALGLCRGKILDIGAGSGCHTLYLQQRHKDVDALDLSPGCIKVMKKRKIRRPVHDNLFSMKGKRYDTLLMLMNGLGICGSIDGLNLFFQFIRSILTDRGQVIADSTDLASLYDAKGLSERADAYYGETCFTMSYQTIVGDPFEWLYIDFDTLNFYAEYHGFTCEKIISDKTGKYLVRIFPQDSSCHGW